MSENFQHFIPYFSGLNLAFHAFVSLKYLVKWQTKIYVLSEMAPSGAV